MTASPLHISISEDSWHAIHTGTSSNPVAEEYLMTMFRRALQIGLPVHLTDESGKKVGRLHLEDDGIRAVMGF